MYGLEDWSSEAVTGTFYQHELQSVNVEENIKYYVDKILKKRTRNKKREVLVRWLLWPKKYDFWIPETDLQNYI